MSRYLPKFEAGHLNFCGQSDTKRWRYAAATHWLEKLTAVSVTEGV